MPRREDGPRADVGRLYDEYGTSLYRYALMLLTDHSAAQDAIHQVFLRLLAVDRTIERDEPYLRRAVRNECYSALRRRQRPGESASGALPLLEPIGTEPSADDRLALEAALRTLPAEQREVVHLHVFAGATFQEIAALTDESINTIASRYRYALARLRQALTP